MTGRSCFTTGSGLNNGTGLTRWLKNGCCLLMEMPPEDQGIAENIKAGDLMRNFLSDTVDPVAKIILKTGDAVMGIDNRSWI